MKKIWTKVILAVATFALAATAAVDQCKPIGWATTQGRTSKAFSVTGGGDASPITVTTFADLQKYAQDNSPRVIYIKGTLGSGWKGTSGDRLEIKGSNKTIIGLNPGTQLKAPIHIGSGVQNIIIRNIVIKGPGSNQDQAWDNLNIDGGAKNIWIDHCEFWDGQDGNADVVKGADNVTFTWCIFGYKINSSHNLSNLIASSDNEPVSEGKLNVTYMFNWWVAASQRKPRCRYGNIHVVNNLFTGDEKVQKGTSVMGISAGKQCYVRAERNHFIDEQTPIHKREGGATESIDNKFTNCSGNTSGTGTSFTPPYEYKNYMISVDEVEKVVRANAGATLKSPTQCGDGNSETPKSSSSEAKSSSSVAPSSASSSSIKVSAVSTSKKYDFVVGRDGDLKKALESAATAKPSANKRYYIFIPDGEYNIGSMMGDGNQKTTFSASYVSIIGQSMEKTVIYNKSVNEGIGITATLFLKGDGIYMQDLTIYNKAVYGNESKYNVTGRHVALQHQGDKHIFKRVRLLSTQDTYYTKSGRAYWEDGEIHGTTDFICGDGDIYFNRCTLRELKKSAMTAAATSTEWGYVFNQCTIDGNSSIDKGFTLGRSWNHAKTVFLNTKMNVRPTDAGWGNPMNSVPTVLGEYNSVDKNGKAVDLSKRRTDFNGTKVNPVFNASQAGKYTVKNVLSGKDSWDPEKLASQIAAPKLSQNGKKIEWTSANGTFCWVLLKDGKFLADVTGNSYDVSKLSEGAKLSVRAANSMGGLGETSNVLSISFSNQPASSSSISSSSAIVSSSSVAVSSSSVVPVSSSTVDTPEGYVQVEDGKMESAVLESTNAGFKGNGYVNFDKGGFVTVNVNVEAGGEYELEMFYANGSTEDRSLKISAGKSEATKTFTKTSAWTEWKTEKCKLNLVAGENTIKIETVAGNDGPNLDQFKLVLLKAAEENTTGITNIAEIGTLHIILDGRNILFQKTVSHARLFSITGLPMRSEKQSNRLSLEGVPSGMYILRAHDGVHQIQRTILVK